MTHPKLKPDEPVQWIHEPELTNQSATKAESIGYQVKMYNLPDVWAMGVDGSGVKIGVCDTGVSRRHVGSELNVIYHGSSVSRESWDDTHSHGTHCCGIIGMKRDDDGAVGVAPGCNLLSEKVLARNGSGTSRDIANGIWKLVDEGAVVISLSIGSPGYSREINEACQYAYDNDVIVVAANGNDGQSNNVDYPAKSVNTLAIAAFDNQLKPASFSDRGPETDMIAPGVNIYSTTPHGYGRMSGTSMATPHAAGTWALAIHAERKYLGRRVTNNVDDCRTILKEFALDLGKPGKDDTFGHGALDIKKYVEFLRDNAEKPDPPIDEPTDPVVPTPENLLPYPVKMIIGEQEMELKVVDRDLGRVTYQEIE